jgi:Flp pilus assembly protein TadB
MSPESEIARERRIERLVGEIEQVIEEADPRERTELRQMASDLLQEQRLTPDNAEAQAATARSGRPLTLLTFGICICVLGVVLFLLVPLIGAFLMVAGAIAVLLSLLGRFIPHSFSNLRHHP